MRRALSALPPRERFVLLQNQLWGHTAREIALMLRVGPKSAEAILTRAKKRFGDLIDGDQENAGPGRLKE